MGVLALLLAQTATVMFGALLSRVPDPFTLMGTFHALYIGWIVVSFVCAALAILGGMGLMRKATSGRTLLLAASFFSLSDLPVGIALSVYTLIVLIAGVPIVKEGRA